MEFDWLLWNTSFVTKTQNVACCIFFVPSGGGTVQHFTFMRCDKKYFSGTRGQNRFKSILLQCCMGQNVVALQHIFSWDNHGARCDFSQAHGMGHVASHAHGNVAPCPLSFSLISPIIIILFSINLYFFL